jgi:hypothetical protein
MPTLAYPCFYCSRLSAILYSCCSVFFYLKLYTILGSLVSISSPGFQKSSPGFFKHESGYFSSPGPGSGFSRVRIFFESESGPGFEVCLTLP